MISRLGLLIVTVLAGPAALADTAGPVRVEDGLLKGTPTRVAGVTAYRGIPFAAAPVGQLRWAPPKPPVRWTGVRAADRYAAACPAARSDVDEAMAEDCLYLNIWTGAASSRERRPVMVWLHGGGFSAGSGSDPKTNGVGLAAKGVVLVTINYRLGALGFLATPGLSRESGRAASGNYGLLDQIAALKWVRRNIAAFGGDPQRVTLFGHSAGGGSVNFLSISPLTKGLFHQALAESQVRWPSDLELRYLSSSWREKGKAERDGTAFLTSVGARSLAEARATPWQALIAKTPVIEPDVDTGTSGRPPFFRPVVDGWVLPRTFSQAFSQRAQNRVTYVAGNNFDEGGVAPPAIWPRLRAQVGPRPPLTMGSPRQIATLTDFQAATRTKFGARAGRYQSLYPAQDDDTAARQSNQSIRDNSRTSTYLWARQWASQTGQPVYTYMWNHAPPGPDHDTRGAYHGSEIWYVFDSLPDVDLAWTADDRRIAGMMSSYWANYARTGDPNGPGLPRWPRFDPARREVMELGDRFGPAPIAEPARVAFWTDFFSTNQAW